MSKVYQRPRSRREYCFKCDWSMHRLCYQARVNGRKVMPAIGVYYCSKCKSLVFYNSDLKCYLRYAELKPFTSMVQLESVKLD